MSISMLFLKLILYKKMLLPRGVVLPYAVITSDSQIWGSFSQPHHSNWKKNSEQSIGTTQNDDDISALRSSISTVGIKSVCLCVSRCSNRSSIGINMSSSSWHSSPVLSFSFSFSLSRKRCSHCIIPITSISFRTPKLSRSSHMALSKQASERLVLFI